MQNLRDAANHEQYFVAKTREPLIRAAQFIGKAAHKGIIGHDTEACFIRHKDDGKWDALELIRKGIDFTAHRGEIFGKTVQEIIDPKGYAVDHDHAGLGRDCAQRERKKKRFFDGEKTVFAFRAVRGDAFAHFGIKRLSRRQKITRPAALQSKIQRMTAFTAADPAGNQDVRGFHGSRRFIEMRGIV